MSYYVVASCATDGQTDFHDDDVDDDVSSLTLKPEKRETCVELSL